MHKDQTYQYGFSDIEKYLKGELSPAAMHALEKAALTDPFLADAIEGYQQSNLELSNIHLSEISTLITGSEEKGRIVPITHSKPNWFKIAALLVLISGITVIGWMLIRNPLSSDSPLASYKEKDSNTAVQTPNEQTITVLAETKQQTNQPSKKTSKATVSTTGNDSSLQALARTPMNTKENIPLTMLHSEARAAKQFSTDSLKDAKSLQNNVARLEQQHKYEQSLQGKVAGVVINNPNSYYTISGKVLDAQQKPLVNASVQLNTASPVKTVSTNAQGAFQISSKQPSANITVSALGYQPVKTSVSPASANIVTLDTQVNTLDEVVVTGYGTKRKKELVGAVKRVESEQINHSSIEPAGGMSEWINTVHRKWETEKWDKLPLRDSISCILILAENGQITDVEFLQPLNRRFKKRFTSFLKQGPIWIAQGLPAKGRHQVIIKF